MDAQTIQSYFNQPRQSSRYLDQYNDLMRRLTEARLAGAPPSVIGMLELQMGEAQRQRDFDESSARRSQATSRYQSARRQGPPRLGVGSTPGLGRAQSAATAGWRDQMDDLNSQLMAQILGSSYNPWGGSMMGGGGNY